MLYCNSLRRHLRFRYRQFFSVAPVAPVALVVSECETAIQAVALFEKDLYICKGIRETTKNIHYRRVEGEGIVNIYRIISVTYAHDKKLLQPTPYS